jgi:Tol biopolymer transport system component
MKTNIKIKGIFLALVMLSSCTGQIPVSTENISAADKNSNQVKSTTAISGKADFPEMGFKLKAELAQLTLNSTVSIIYPASHATKANQTVASGLTDDSGNFIINPDSNFAPAIDETFILEATKRLGDNLVALMTIRTIIKWTASGWESISSPGIKINVATTALAVISDLNPAVNQQDFINKINSGTGVITAVNAEITAQTVKDVSGMVYDVLAKNQDPFKYIGKEGSIYKIINKDIFNINKPVGTHTMLYYSSSGADKLKVLDLDNGKTTDLMRSLDNDIIASEASFTGDRKKVIFVGRTRDMRYDLYSVDANGGSYENLSKSLTTGSMSQFKSSPDRTKFVFLLNSNLWLYNYTANTLTNLTGTMSATGISLPKWSPDSTKVAFCATKSSRRDLYVINISNISNIIKISNDSSASFTIKITNTDTDAYWSPDSTRLMFQANMTTANRTDVYTVNADGSSLTSLTGASSNIYNNVTNNSSYPTDFSPDSQKVVYKSGATNNNQTTYIKILGTGTIRTISTVFSPTFYKWSPDSQKVVFYGSATSGGANNFYIGYADGTATSTMVPDSGKTMSQAVFSANSDKIVYTMINTSIAPNRTDIYVSPLSNLASRTNLTADLTGAPQLGNWYEFNANEPKILFYSSSNLYWLNTDGTGRTDLGIYAPGIRKWSNDRTKLIYNPYQVYNVWEMDMAGIKRQVTSDSPDELKNYLQFNF